MKFMRFKKEFVEFEHRISFLIKRHFLSGLVAILLVWFILANVNLKETWGHLMGIPISIILLVFAINFVQYCLRIFRWKLIIDKIGPVGYWILFPIFFAGGLINQLTPGTKSGGQPLRAYYIYRIEGLC